MSEQKIETIHARGPIVTQSLCGVVHPQNMTLFNYQVTCADCNAMIDEEKLARLGAFETPVVKYVESEISKASERLKEAAAEAQGEEEPELIDHPAHYNQYKGLEIIDLVEQMNFNRGNAVKYIARAGFKDPETELQDLEKALWYIEREIQRLEAE